MSERRRLLVVGTTYKGTLIMENGALFIIYIGTMRYEFTERSAACTFIDG
jgi:hypothetical protein